MSRSKPPIVTLLSDFGLEDTFTGQMKGVILSASPDAALVDLTHLIPPQSILAGAIHLRAAWRSFPEHTVHLAVVDPGVGSDRRAIAFSYENHVFVGPDNGLLTGVLHGATPTEAVQLDTSREYVSQTFHGRDVFAVAAGRIAAGSELSEVGTTIDPDSLQTLNIPKAEVGDGVVHGEILLIDHYGNAITNIDIDALKTVGSYCGVESGNFVVSRLSATYSDVRSGDPLALVSSMNTLELSVRDGSAATRYDLSSGMKVNVISDSAHEWHSREAAT